MADLEDLLVKTSRTFALSIPLLEGSTRAEVTLAYLLFRIIDTFEDASHWAREDRIAALGEFTRILTGEDEEAAARLAPVWVERGPSDNEGYVELIGEVPAVLQAFWALDPSARDSIQRHTLRTAEGMAEIVARTTDTGHLELETIADLRRYCYIVAGIVGEMLTELFLLETARLQGERDYLTARAATFGEALQLVNILKDSADDALEGRRYLPRAVSREEVFALARADLQVAAEYVDSLHRGGAPRGSVAFCALPVLLAEATLERVERRGPGSKLTRPEVATIVATMNQHLDEGRPVDFGLASVG